MSRESFVAKGEDESKERIFSFLGEIKRSLFQSSTCFSLLNAKSGADSLLNERYNIQYKLNPLVRGPLIYLEVTAWTEIISETQAYLVYKDELSGQCGGIALFKGGQ